MQQELKRIYQDHRQGLFTLALSITRCPDLAEDAVHDAFVRLWRSKIRPKGDSVAYVFASVRNAALEQMRQRRRAGRLATAGVSLLESGPSDTGPDDPASNALEAERQRHVRRAVETLPTRQRQVVVLRLHSGLTFQQIAEVFGEPLQTVASRYRRALGRMKETLGKLM